MSLPQPIMDAGGPLETVPMARRQVLILVTAVLLAALDGYDALSMAFVAPVLSKAWNIDKAVLGLLLSSGLVGMAFGSIFISPVADKVGRKPVVLGSLLLMIAGAALSAHSINVPMLAVARVATGVGIGSMIAMTTLISAEFSNARSRPLAVAAVATIGFPLGGIIGGLGAAALIRNSGWEMVFVAGAVAGAVLFLLVALTLPESPAFLITRRSPEAQTRLKAIMLSFGHTPSEGLGPNSDSVRAPYSALFETGTRHVTVRLIGINLLAATAAYYLVNWLPQLIADAGFPPETGSIASAVSGLAGFVGGVSLGALAIRYSPTRISGSAMAGLAFALAGIGLAPPVLGVLLGAAACFGFFLAGMTGTLYGVLAGAFPSSMRASGIGLVMGIGRIASAVGPALAGWMFAHGMGRASVSLIFALAPLVAAGLMITFRPRDQRVATAARNPL